MRYADEDDRLGLLATINGVEYPEYTPVGWLKAGPLRGLRVFGPQAQQLVADYTEGRVDGIELRLRLIQLFLERELCMLIPESYCALAIANTPLRQVDLAGAQRVVDAIIKIGEAKGIDYAQLRRWLFSELLHPESVEWFANSPPVQVRPGEFPAVVGLDRELLAIFWLG
jgi:hypothetical protein